MPSTKVVMMTTGTQGEPSSILGRLAVGAQSPIRHLEQDDTVIFSSHPIPGNEELVHRTINRLFQRGAHVIYDPIAPVHVSGHASAEEMKLLIHLVRPKHVIPIHGELRHLKQHGAIARELGIPGGERGRGRERNADRVCRWTHDARRSRAGRLRLRGRHGRRRYRPQRDARARTPGAGWISSRCSCACAPRTER